MSRIVATLVYSRCVGAGKTPNGDSSTSIARKAVLACMADRASDDGTGVYLSKARISDEIEAGENTVRRAIASLVEDGLLREVGPRKVANGYVMEFDLDVAKIAALPLGDPNRKDPFQLNPLQLEGVPPRKGTPSATEGVPLPPRRGNLNKTRKNHRAGARAREDDARTLDDVVSILWLGTRSKELNDSDVRQFKQARASMEIHGDTLRVAGPETLSEKLQGFLASQGISIEHGRHTGEAA